MAKNENKEVGLVLFYFIYLLLERDDGVIGGVEQNTTVVDAENGAFDLKHDVSIDVCDGEGSFLEGHELLDDDQIHRVWCAELRVDDGDRVGLRRVARRSWVTGSTLVSHRG